MASDLTKLPQEILVDLINTDNSSSIAINAVVLGSPAIVPDTTGTVESFNVTKTTLNITAAPNSGYKGNVDVVYDRIAYRNVFPTTDDVSVEFATTTDSYDLSTNVNVSDLLPALNAKYNLNLQPLDFVETALPVFTGPPPYAVQTVLLQAQPTSLVFIGGINIPINPNLYPLTTLLASNVLNGLVYDNGDVDDGDTLASTQVAFHTLLNTTMAQPGYF